MKIETEKIILDVDTGVDDALAILLLLKLTPEKVLGICTAGGNVEVEQTTKNTLSVLSLQKKSINVYKGSGHNLKNENFIYAKDYHGENGLCGLTYYTSQKTEETSAEDFIIDSADKYPGKLTLIILDAPTNLAKALLKKPAIAQKIKQVIIMGGAVKVKGNQTDTAEFNFYQDPLAVKVVFESIKNIYLIPLDVTGKCLIYKEDIDQFKDNSPYGLFIRAMISKWYEIFGKPKNRFFELYDPLAVSAVLGDFLDFSTILAQVITEGEKKGSLVLGKGKSIQFAHNVREKDFSQFFLEQMNESSKLIIFDMDGTLYEFEGGSYAKSSLKPKVTANALKFICKRLKVCQEQAEKVLAQIKKKYGDQISIGLEKEYQIDRYEFFNNVWDISAHEIIKTNFKLPKIIETLARKNQLIIVSSAPRIWIERVLEELQIKAYFSHIYSGESDFRKEFTNVFKKIIADLGYEAEDCFSIGDQGPTDILPAKEIGIKTIFLNSYQTCAEADMSIKNINDLELALKTIGEK